MPQTRFSPIIALLFFPLIAALLMPQEAIGEPQRVQQTQTENEFENFRSYGINDKNLAAEKRTVKPHETLSRILKAVSIPSSTIDTIAKKANGVFDLKSIKADAKYLILRSSPNKIPQYIIYYHNEVSFIVFRLQEPISVFKGEKETNTELVAAGGMINRSLWESIQAAGCNLSLVKRLSDLYSWAVDFHHLQRGDRFAVVYERRVTGDRPVGINQVSAACFTHRNRDFYVFQYRSEKGTGYYDENGNGIRRTFLKAPLKYTCITSKFSPGRLHPVLNYSRPHLGTDFAAPEGTPVMSVGDGQVLESRYHKELGNHIKIRHDGVYCTQYLHLSRFAQGIKPGVHLKQGQIIGYVGKTGIATGPHLEFRLWKNGKAVDIFKENLPASQSLEGKDKKRFLHEIASLKQDLDELKNNNETPVKLTYLKRTTTFNNNSVSETNLTPAQVRW